MGKLFIDYYPEMLCLLGDSLMSLTLILFYVFVSRLHSSNLPFGNFPEFILSWKIFGIGSAMALSALPINTGGRPSIPTDFFSFRLMRYNSLIFLVIICNSIDFSGYEWFILKLINFFLFRWKFIVLKFNSFSVIFCINTIFID